MNTPGGSRSKRLIALFAVGAIAVLTAVLPATSAQAASFSLYPTSAKTQTVEFGSNWNVAYHLSRTYYPCSTYCSASFDVKIAGQATNFVDHYSDYPGDYLVSFGSYSSDRAPLAVGTYVMSLVYRQTGNRSGTSSSSVTLNVVPAKLTTTVDIQSDPNHKSHAILSAAMTGDFIDVTNRNSDAPKTPQYPRLPAGTWNFTVKNPSGSVIHTAAVKSAAGAPPSASDYWTDLPPATVFSASAIFAPDPAVVSDFSPSAADAVSYTSAQPPAGQVTPTAPPTATPVAAPTGGVPIPTWAAGVWGLVVLILVIGLLVLVFRRTERPQKQPRAAAATPGISADGAPVSGTSISGTSQKDLDDEN